VVINLSDQTVSDYTLNLPKTTLTGDMKAKVLFGEGTVIAPTLADAGAIKDYTPLATLAPYSTTIIQLQAAS
jgi:hypothetical protein